MNVRRSFWKSWDAQGGELPAVDESALKQADFVTFPDSVEGATCGNCQYNEADVCRNLAIEGQPVNGRNCCSLWDSPGTLRAWE